MVHFEVGYFSFKPVAPWDYLKRNYSGFANMLASELKTITSP